MEIKTKFSIGDKAFYKKDNSFISVTIRNIGIIIINQDESKPINKLITYYCNEGSSHFKEEELIGKQEMIAQIGSL